MLFTKRILFMNSLKEEFLKFNFMKALSIKQPWASLIAYGIKDIENRTWKTNFRGRIYIHASGTGVKDKFSALTKEQRFEAETHPKDFNVLYFDDLPKSAIIGEVDIIDCVINHESIWSEHVKPDDQLLKDVLGIDPKPIYNWVLENAVLYDEPILNVKGKLSLWDFEK